jgi:hypothetical protein
MRERTSQSEGRLIRIPTSAYQKQGGTSERLIVREGQTRSMAEQRESRSSSFGLCVIPEML